MKLSNDVEKYEILTNIEYSAQESRSKSLKKVQFHHLSFFFLCSFSSKILEKHSLPTKAVT